VCITFIPNIALTNYDNDVRKLRAKKRKMALMIGFHLEGFFELSSATCFTRDPASKKDHVLTFKLGGLQGGLKRMAL